MLIRARLMCEYQGLLEPAPPDITEFDLFRDMKVVPYDRAGFRLYVVHMPVPVATTEAHFAAIVHKLDEPHEPMRASPSTRYFTLEKSFLNGPPLLCEWTQAGSHLNYGEGPGASAEPFVAAVLQRLGGG